MNEQKKTAHVEPGTEQDVDTDRRAGRREWLGQVDFWENVKELILRRIPPGSRPIEQLY